MTQETYPVAQLADILALHRKWVFDDPDPSVECGHGIHFFLTRIEAEEYR